MVVMAVGDQHRVDLGQRLEGNARIVDAPGAREGHRRDALRPDRVGQDVAPASLDQLARVADEGDAQARAGNTRRRPVRIGTRIHERPFGLVAGGPPAHELAKTLRRHAVGVEEAHAVEMVGDGAVVVAAGGGGARRERAGARGGGGGEQGKHPAARELHAKNPGSPAIIARIASFRWRRTFGRTLPAGGLTPSGGIHRFRALSQRARKFARRPARKAAGGQRPTARCALGRICVWNVR